MKTREFRSTAEVAMPWGIRVSGDASAVRPAEGRADMTGVLVRPMGERNACAPGEAVTVRTDGHILALIDGSSVSVELRKGKARP